MSVFIKLLIISISLALDALTVSAAEGVREKKVNIANAFKISVFFGGFQFIMPLIGWFLEQKIHTVIYSIGHWVAFILLLIIGIKMINEAFQEKPKIKTLNNKLLFILAIATSIDALAVGITFAFIGLPLILSVISIGLITFVLCFAGFLLGNKLGTFFKGKIEILGGFALIFLGIKILLESF